MKTNYCLGFLFNHDLSEVVLIRKAKKDWQEGLLNGIGGRVEFTEGCAKAMEREWREETGNMTQHKWAYVGYLRGVDWQVFVFTAKTTVNIDLTSGVEGTVAWYDDSYTPKCIPNVKWLVPLCQDFLQNPESFKTFHADY